MANSLSTSRTCPEHGHFRMEFRKHRTSMNILISENIKRYSRALVNNNGSIKYIIISSFALRAIEIMMLCAVIIAKSFFGALTVWNAVEKGIMNRNKFLCFIFLCSLSSGDLETRKKQAFRALTNFIFKSEYYKIS